MVFVVDQDPVHSALTLRTKRSANAFARGVRAGVLITWMPSAAKTASNDPPNFESRSRMRNRNAAVRSPRSMTRLRACWVVHAAVGWAVTPSMWTRRLVRGCLDLRRT